MANEGYDKKADAQHNPFGENKATGKPVSSDDLHNYEDQTARANSDASNAFGKGRSTTGDDGGGYYAPHGDESRSSRAFSRVRNGRDKLLGRARRNKLLVGAVLGSSGILIILIIVITVLVGAYKIVDFAEHVGAYEFARSTAQMAEETSAIDSEKFGLDSLLSKYSGTRGVRLYTYLQGKYTSASGSASTLWSKFDNYRPSQIMQNFHDDGAFKLETSTSVLGNTYISGVTGTAVNGSSAPLQTRSLSNAVKNHLIPGYKFATRDVAISRSVAPGLIEELKAAEIGPITRARFASAIREELGVSLTAWQVGKFLGTPEENDAAEQELSFNFGEGSSPTPPVGADSQYTSAAQKLQSAEAADAQNAATSVNPNKLSLNLKSILNQGFSLTAYNGLQGVLMKAVTIINPIYAVASPVCLVYDGSMQKSQAPIDYASQQAEREGILVQTEAGQEKEGTNVNAQAVGAADWKLGDITTSNAEMRSQGTPVDTSDFVSTEQSSGGQYTYSLADSLPGPLATIAKDFGSACPAITNLWVGAATGVASLLTLPDFSADDGLIAGATRAITDFIPSSMQDFGEKLAATKGSISSFAFKVGATSAGLYGATLLAQRIVASDAGAVHSSLDTDQSYDNTVDDGTNIYANQIEQQQFFGAPLTDQNLAQDNLQDQAQLSEANSKQDAYQRYVALSNPNSLFSDLIVDASGLFNSSFFASLLRLGSTLLDPIRTVGSVLSPWISHSSFAASTVTSANTFYGNVQFGFTPYETSLIENDATYKPLENQLYLDQSGQEANIAARYSVCFDGSLSIGTMLANGYIQRKADGDIVPNQGLCSPSNLGTGNGDVGGNNSYCNGSSSNALGCDYTGCPNNKCGPDGAGFDDLVFRWRVAQSYNNTLDQLTSEQTVTTSDTTPSSPTTPVATNGYENPLRDVTSLGTSRVDEGVDFTGSGPVYAMGNGTIVDITNSGWAIDGGPPTFIVYKLSDGPAAGKFVYVAENCIPSSQISTSPPNNQVTSNTVLCTMVNESPHLETGWANGSALGDALAHGVYIELASGESYATAYGQNFRELLDSVGVTVKSCYDFTGVPLSGGPLDPSWPTWTTSPATKSGTLAC